jgi:threonine/homoserine/homoserine lactone efflux protein
MKHKSTNNLSSITKGKKMLDSIAFISWPISAVLIGFIISIPLGPSAVIVFEKALGGQMKQAISAISGILLAELFYMALAMAGYLALIAQFPKALSGVGILGAFLIIFLGLNYLFPNTFKKPVKKITKEKNQKKSSSPFLLTFMISIINPANIFIFLMLVQFFVSTYSFSSERELVLPMILVETGVFLWFSAMIILIRYLPANLISKIQNKIESSAGVALTIFGISLLTKNISNLI